MTSSILTADRAVTAEALEVVRSAAAAPVRRRRRIVVGLTLLVATLVTVRVLLGTYTVTVPDFFRIVSGTTIPGASFIVMEVKLPRAVLGVLVGLAFGVAGAVFQATLRNPLASPDVIGVSAGASAAAVAAVVGLGLSGWGISVAAVVGALGTAALVRLVAGDHATHRLVLGGIGVQAAMLSVIHYFFTRADEWDAQLVLRWITGSLNQAGWTTITVLLLVLALLLPATAWSARSVRVVELGDDLARSLGERPARQMVLLALATLLAAVGVAAAGPIAFVAFLAGPIARRLNSGRTTLVGAGLVGAAIVVAADFTAAELLGGTNFPVGVVTGVLGAPFLLWLVATGRTRRRTA